MLLAKRDDFFYNLPGAEENEEVGHPPKDGLDFAEPHDGDDCLTTGLSNAGNVVGDGRRNLNTRKMKRCRIV